MQLDVLENDKLGRLSLSIEGCKKRDKYILEMCHKNSIPVQVSMGGGYSLILKNIIEAHSNTFRLAQEIYSDYNYINSKKGFWYYFNEEKKINDKKANFGDLIEFNYSVKGLDNNIIYDIQTVGDQSYMMD